MAGAPAFAARTRALSPSRLPQLPLSSAPWLPLPTHPPPSQRAEALAARAARPARRTGRLLVTQLGNGELHLLDEQRAVAGFGLGILYFCLRQDQRLALREDHRVRGSEVDGKRIIRATISSSAKP